MADPLPVKSAADSGSSKQSRLGLLLLVFLVAAIATGLVAWVLISIFSRKQEARTPALRVVELSEVSVDPVPWGLNWPHHFDSWKSTAGDKFYGGSSAMPASKLDQQPWLKRLYAGYAFSLDYREARGHAYMLYDQGVTERVNQRPQSGACLHCHSSINVLYRSVGLEKLGEEPTLERLASSFDMNAVQKGFEVLSTQPYHDVLTLLMQAPDGTPEENQPVFPQPHLANHPPSGEAHPVTCIDCHDPTTMTIRVTRPGFINGIRKLAESDAVVQPFSSINQWRNSNRSTPYDPNTHATRQEMRSFVCGQCHVEYYCANKMTLTYPWNHGLKVEQIEKTWEQTTFPDGEGFFDYLHGETAAPVFKAQHPEFELWSQGIHARSGVSCADCHMPYQRIGAAKVSSHNVRSPLEDINAACQTCHPQSETELRARIETIQERHQLLLERSGQAMTEMVDAILEAKATGVDEQTLKPIYALQRKAMWRLDFISSENSRGFHADQEAARILAESIDFSRQAQAAALRLRAPQPPSTEGIPFEGVQGVTPREE